MSLKDMGIEETDMNLVEMLEKEIEFWKNKPPGSVGPHHAKYMYEHYISKGLEHVERETATVMDLGREVPITLPIHILDFGCGIGRLRIGLDKTPCIYTGIDISPKLITFAKKNCSIYNDTKFMLLNTHMLPFNDNMFDLILCYSVFTHIHQRQIEVYMREFERITKPQGIMMPSIIIDKTRLVRIIHEWFEQLYESLDLELIKSFRIEDKPAGADQVVYMLRKKK